MTIPQTKQIINLLKNKGVEFTNGLSDIEMIEVEKKFDIKFPSDLKRFLQIQLPISYSFINWRQGLFDKDTENQILDILNWPLKGILFDLRNGSWLSIWGDEPLNHEDRIALARLRFASVPKLVPIYSHRYIPCEPNEAGNPVFSVYQTDIIYYGYDLATYFANEFYFKLNNSFEVLNMPNREIEFWSWCVENN